MEIPKEHATQYDMLRGEIVSLIAETRKLEFAAVGGIAALYAWLANSGTEGAIWFIGVPLVLLAGVRSFTLFKRIEFIAAYLRRIEEKFFVEDKDLPGYERYFEASLRASARGGKTSRLAPTALALWIALLLASLIAPFIFDKTDKGEQGGGCNSAALRASA